MANPAKIRELQTEQNSLRAFRPTKDILQIQQEALRKSLLIDLPRPEGRGQKIRRLKGEAMVLKDTKLQREARERKEKRVLEKLKKDHNTKVNGLFSIGFHKKR